MAIIEISLPKAAIVRKNKYTIFLEGYNGIPMTMSRQLEGYRDPQFLADQVYEMLFLIACSIGQGTLDDAVSKIRIRPPQKKNEPKFVQKAIAFAGGAMPVHIPTRVAGPVAEFSHTNKTLTIYMSPDWVTDIDDVIHEVGHSIDYMISAAQDSKLKRIRNRTLRDRIIPRIEAGATPTMIADRVLTEYAFFTTADEDSFRPGARVFYRGFAGLAALTLWSSQYPKRTIKSLRVENDPGEFFPELFMMYMLRPKRLEKSSPELYALAAEMLEGIIGREIRPITDYCSEIPTSL